MTTFGDMVYHSGGVPVISGGLPVVAGSVYWVSSLLGSSAYDGRKEFPFDTLSRALDFSTINDCIILMPGHVENITTTRTFAIDQAGTIVWGLGQYDYRPTFSHTVIAAYAKIEAANVWIHNIKFVAGTTGTNTGLLVDAVGAKVTDCVFEEVAASTYCYDECLITGATANDAEGLHIANCLFYQDSAESSGGIIVPINQNNVKITNNRFYGTWTTGGGPIVLSSTVAVIGLEITHNLISNTQSSATKSGITVLSDAAQGIVAYNCLVTAGSSGQNLGTGIQVSASGTIGVFENYVTGRPAESGRLDPAVFSTA